MPESLKEFHPESESVSLEIVITKTAASQLLKTMKQFNTACTAIARLAAAEGTRSKTKLQKLFTQKATPKQRIPTKLITHAVSKVLSVTHSASELEKIKFHPTDSMPFTLTLEPDAPDLATVPTLDGNIKVPFRPTEPYPEGLTLPASSEATLIHRDGSFSS